MPLSHDQILLLNYLNASPSEEGTNLILKASKDHKTVGEIAQMMLDNPATYTKTSNKPGSFDPTPEQMRTALQAIVNDNQLKTMTIDAAGKDGTGNLHYIVSSPEGQAGREAVVVYSGTTGYREWVDDFQAGAMTDSPVQQEMMQFVKDNASILEGCDYVTTSGHSKGANVAQYIALLYNGVDRCVCFDGEGFSDEFFQKYADEIAMRQDIITNYAADKDYVNILLNKVGQTIYIEGHGAEDSFFLNHSLFTLLDMKHPDASLSGPGRQTTQDPGLNELDQMLNSYLRTLSGDDKRQTLEILGNIVASVLAGDRSMTAEEWIKLIANSGNRELVANMFSYILQYLKDHPERADKIIATLNDIMGGLGDVIKTVADVVDNDFARVGMQVLIVVLKPLLSQLGLGGYVINLLLRDIGIILGRYGKFDTTVSGDLKIDSVAGAPVIAVDADLMDRMASMLDDVSSALQSLAGDAIDAAEACQTSAINLNLNITLTVKMLFMYGLSGTPESILRKLSDAIRKTSDKTNQLRNSLKQAAELCREAERKTERSFAALSAGLGG